MAKRLWTALYLYSKPLLLAAALLSMAGCSTNPATGESQFTALMSPAQETDEGARGHKMVAAAFGLLPADDPVPAYVARIGAKVAAHTERPEVSYKFFVLDTAVVNAFALPGGYIYVTRGMLAQANSEAELAAVLAHETGHITARHAAERYSEGMLTSFGAAVVGGAVGSSAGAQAAGMGSELVMQSYSRGQEAQADELGIRYLAKAGYDPLAMAAFLKSLHAGEALEQKLRGGRRDKFDFFATHPETKDRIAQAVKKAAEYPRAVDVDGRAAYLRAIDGLPYGDGVRQGVVRGRRFWHPALGFTFEVPPGYTIRNGPTQVAASSPAGGAMIFDSVASTSAPAAYLAQDWMKGETLDKVGALSFNGLSAAAASFPGTVRGRAVTIRVVAAAWDPHTIFRFQTALPQGAPAAEMDQAIASLRRMTEAEKAAVRPLHVRIVTAQAGDTVATLARGMAFEDLQEERFRALNGLAAGEKAVAGQVYKIVAP